jgi:diaminohydroxyphosphoribosylaminopyrimidine deaminase/5-amino-6-(5-phosphoribosylamino)uracil reductase
MLEQAGIRVSVGTGEKKARLLNSSFIKYSQTSLPWVVLKWAQSIDGFLTSCSDNSEERWLSCEASRKDVHKLRRSCDAIMAGIGTALADNPLLTARPDKGRSPHRFVLDSRLRIDTSLKMFQTTDIAPLTVITTSEDLARIEEIEKAGAVVMAVGAEKNGRCSLTQTLKLIGEMGMQRLVVEGGPALLSEFMRQSLADEAQIYIAPKLLAGTGAASISEALRDISSLSLHHSETTTFDNDAKITARFRNIAEL